MDTRSTKREFIMKQFLIRMTAVVALLFSAGCSGKPGPEQKVKDGVDFAKRTFERLNRDPIADAAFGSICETGGSPLSYLAACINDPADLPPFAHEKPDSPYSVVVSYDNKQNCFVIEGYTDNITKPAIVEKVTYKGGAVREKPGKAQTKEQLNIALLEASSGGETGTVQSLISQGADVNARSNEGGTPLMYACAKGHAAVAQILISAGADPKARAGDQNAWPVIMLAAESGTPEIISLLLEKGADPNVCDRFKDTPLMLASLRGHAQAVELLIKAGANINAQEIRRNNFPLLHAVSRGHTNAAAVLIKSGANVNQSDISGMTPLMSCSEKGYTEIAASLIKARANLEAKLTGDIGAGATALMLAAAKGHEEMIRLLLNSGANPKATDKNGSTAYRYAVHNGRTAIAEILQAAEKGTMPKAPPVSATTGSQTISTPGTDNSADPQSLIGKDQKAADAMFGRPEGKVKKGDTIIIMYRDAEVTVKQNIITEVRR